jgi:hypothetical protein
MYLRYNWQVERSVVLSQRVSFGLGNDTLCIQMPSIIPMSFSVIDRLRARRSLVPSATFATVDWTSAAQRPRVILGYKEVSEAGMWWSIISRGTRSQPIAGHIAVTPLGVRWPSSTEPGPRKRTL